VPLLFLSAAFLAGIVLGKYLPLPWWVWVIGGLLFLLLTIINRIPRQRFRFWQQLNQFFHFAPGLILVVFFIGACRYLLATTHVSESDLAWYNDHGEFSLVGVVSAPAEVFSDRVLYQINFSEISDTNSSDYSTATKTISGKALVTMPRWQSWQYGDLLQFTGTPYTPKEYVDFSYKDYLARQGIQSVIYYPTSVQKVGEKAGIGFRRWLIMFREKAREVILSSMPQPEAGLLEGILLGLENDMPASLTQAFRDTGTAHIIAISGFNMTLIATLLITAFSRLFRRYWGVLGAIVVITVYTLFVNGSAAVTRAAIMASTAAVAHLVGRRQSGINALFFTAVILCLFNPLLLWDVSFRLSFMAVLGLVLFGQPLQNYFTRLVEKWLGEEKATRLSSPVSEYFLFTLAAQLTTLPIVALQFKRFSLVSLLANPLILPAQPAILEAGMVSTLAGLIHPILGKFFAMFTWPLLAYTNFMVTTLAKIKGAALNLHPLAAFWILIAVLLILLVFLLHNFFKKQFGNASTAWLILLLIAGSFSAWSIFAHQPDGNLHVRLVNSGENSTLFMQTPGGSNLLFDLPGEASETSAALTPFLSPWAFRLDALILTRPINESSLTDLNQMLAVKTIVISNAILRPSVDSYPLQVPENSHLLTIAEEVKLEIEPGLTLTLIGETPGQAAYSIQYNDVCILIPAGVDYALLKEHFPELMHQPDILILTPDDISYIPPRLWVGLQPGSILWNSLEVSPFTSSLYTTATGDVDLITDGNAVWMKK
jgi:competence protein ComEC